MVQEKARKDLKALREHDVVLHGSAVTGRATPRSDIDVAVVSHDWDPGSNRELWRRILGRVPPPYDVRVYELLPLPIQVRIAERHVVVFGDPVQLSYEFYHARRRWKDQGRRQEENRFRSIEEKRDALKRAKARGYKAL